MSRAQPADRRSWRRPGSWSEAEAWRRAAALAAVLCVLLFVLGLAFEGPDPGGAWGLAYGIGAAFLLTAGVLYGARRRIPRLASRLRLGRARAWLYFHVWGGALFLLLMLMHSGLRLPTGALTLWLWWISVWTVASGWLGLGLQRWIPKVLTSGLGTEVHFDRIPALVEELRHRAEELAAGSEESIRNLHGRRVAPALAAPHPRLVYFFDITGGIRSRLKEFEYLRGFLGGEEKETLARLERIYRAKLEIDAHYTLQQALRLWLFLHVPPALVALLLLLLHVFTVLYY